MKIALLTAGIWPIDIGGIQKHSYCLAKYLAQEKVFVDVFTSLNKDNNFENLTIENFFTEDELKYINFIHIPFPKLFRIPGHYILSSWIFSKNIFQKMKSSKGYDVIYAQGFTSWYLLYKGCKMLKVKTITNLHGMEMYQHVINFTAKYQQYFLRIPASKIIQKSNWLISLGGKLSVILIENGAKPSTIHVIPNGVDEHWLKKSSGENIQISKRKFVFIGRYERRKGIEELTEVLRELQTFPSVEFHFVGPIPNEKRFINENIFYHGLINETEKIKSILDGSDVLICPSHSEGMPTVILEAMACHCAIIATDVGAVSLQVSHDNGWLIPTKNKKQP